jgi:hypothetical protein
MEDGGAGAVLEGMWLLPACPEDPAGVIDTLWVYCPSASSYLLFRTHPGGEEWEKFIAATGDPAQEVERYDGKERPPVLIVEDVSECVERELREPLTLPGDAPLRRVR